jgi:hypothetical protein
MALVSFSMMKDIFPFLTPVLRQSNFLHFHNIKFDFVISIASESQPNIIHKLLTQPDSKDVVAVS